MKEFLALVAHENHVTGFLGGKFHQEGLHLLVSLPGFEGLVYVIHFALAVVGSSFHSHAFTTPGYGYLVIAYIVLEEIGQTHVQGPG